jgi:hypothetical protein
MLRNHLNKKKECESIFEDVSREKLLNELELKIEKIYSCKNCDKILSTRQNKWKHEQICKIVKNDEIIHLKNEISEIKKILLENHTNTNINSNNNNNNIVNNNIINNTIIINDLRPFGKENYDYIKIDDFINIIRSSKKVLMKLFQKIHFDGNHPENWNFYISNNRSNKVNIFTGKKFESKDKKDSIEALLNKNIIFLENFINTLNEINEDEKELIIEGIKNYININQKVNDEDYKYDFLELINFICDLAYNKKEKIELVKKELDKMNKKELDKMNKKELDKMNKKDTVTIQINSIAN